MIFEKIIVKELNVRSKFSTDNYIQNFIIANYVWICWCWCWYSGSSCRTTWFRCKDSSILLKYALIFIIFLILRMKGFWRWGREQKAWSQSRWSFRRGRFTNITLLSIQLLIVNLMHRRKVLQEVRKKHEKRLQSLVWSPCLVSIE